VVAIRAWAELVMGQSGADGLDLLVGRGGGPWSSKLKFRRQTTGCPHLKLRRAPHLPLCRYSLLRLRVTRSRALQLAMARRQRKPPWRSDDPRLIRNVRSPKPTVDRRVAFPYRGEELSFWWLKFGIGKVIGSLLESILSPKSLK